MNLDKLQYFIDLINTGSFTKTEQKNHIAQTSVSQQIRSLENYFNVQLIDRSVQPIVPTAAGQLLYSEAVPICQQYQKLEQDMADFCTDKQRIRLEYTSVIDLNFLIKITKTLKQQSHLVLELEKEQLKDVAHDLNNGQYDLAISFDSEFYNEDSLQTITLYQGKYCALIDKEHPLYHCQTLSLKQLYHYPFVMLAPQTIGKSYQLMLEHARQDGFTPQIKATVQDLETEIFLIQTQHLIGFFPDNYPLPTQTSNLKLLPIKQTHHHFKIVLAYRNDFDHTKLAHIIHLAHSISAEF